MYSSTFKSSILIVILLFTGLMLPNIAEAHCDSMDGPVVLVAQDALETGNINLVLIWVNADQENEIRKSFQKTLEVRDENEKVRELATRTSLRPLCHKQVYSRMFPDRSEVDENAKAHFE